jgi:outer membrane receptor protein involved in Fe transport
MNVKRGPLLPVAIVLLSTSVLVTQVAAQTSYSVSGVVRDRSTNTPVVAALVQLTPGLRRTMTDAAGVFTITGLRAGRYQLDVRGTGYQPRLLSITLGQTPVTPLEIQLEQAPIALPRVTVTAPDEIAELRAGPLPVSVVDVQQIAGRSTDLNEVLNRVVGVRVRRTGGLGSAAILSLRGLEGKRIEVFVDGNPLNSPDGNFGINDIPTQLIERIEVYRGIVPARFGGQGLGGAVNVVLREEPMPYVDAAGSLQSYDVLQGTVIAKHFWGAGKYSLAAAVIGASAQNDYRMESPYEPGLRIDRDHDAYRSLLGGMGFTARRAYFDKIQLETFVFGTRKEVQGVQRNIQHAEQRNAAYAGALRVEKSGFLVPALALEYSISAPIARARMVDTSAVRYEFNGSTYPSPSLRGEVGQYPRLSNDRLWEVRQRFNLEWRLAARQSFNFHVNARYSKTRPQDTLANRFAGRNVSAYPGRLFTLQSSLTHEASLAGGRLVNLAGVKYNWFSSRGRSSPLYTLVQEGEPPAFSPSVGAAGFSNSARLLVAGSWYLKASAERAFRAPDPTELFGDGSLIAPAPALLPERSWNASLGLLYNRSRANGGRIQIEANAFLLRVSDYITLAGIGFARGHVNTGEVRIAGLDVDARIDLSPALFLYGNGTWQDLRDVTRTLPGTSVPNPTHGLRIPNAPYLFGSAGIEWRSRLGAGRNLKVFVETGYTHRYFYAFQVSQNQERVIPTSFVQDVGIEQGFFDNRITLSTEIHNLTDSRVINVLNNPLPGRTFRVKLRYTQMRGTT